MPADPKRSETLLSVSPEPAAAAIVAALAERQVNAIVVGNRASEIEAAAPRTVAVVVKRIDFDRARQAMAQIRQQHAEIDWPRVSVMETAETPLTARRPLVPIHIWWMLELMGIVLCCMQWAFTDKLTPGLIYVLATLALTGLFLALLPFADRRRSSGSFSVY